jgi:alpha-mannosidase
VRQPFTALQFLDLTDETRGLLYLHDGSQAFFREGERVLNILSMYDPWDEDYFVAELRARVRIVPHGPIDHARRWRLAQEFTRPALIVSADRPGGDIPASFGGARCDATGVALTALFRETEEAGAGIAGYAGAGMGFPYVLRLVELNGAQTTARVSLPGPVPAAYRANLLGEHPEPLAVTEAATPEGAGPRWSEVELALRPYEIATLYLDLELGRKVNRDLDAHRGVWATVHRVE